MIIVSHVPKSAGNSFKMALRGYFGDRLLSISAGAEKMIDPTTDIPDGFYVHNSTCLFGHLAPAQFLPLKEKHNIKFMTWMRHPVERIVSHYRFLPEVYDGAGPLQQRVVDEKWGLMEFCLSPEFRNLYSRYYDGFGLENFDFIGLVEYYKEDLDWVSRRWFDGELEYYYLLKSVYNHIDLEDWFKIFDYHQQDVELYRKAWELRKNR